MPRIALVIGGQVRRIENRTNQPPDIEHKSVQWKPVVGSPPNYDPLIELLEGPTYSVGVGNVTEEWTKRDLTVQELSDKKDAAVNSINGLYSPILRALHNLNNRVRVLEGQQTISLNQFKAAIKALL